MAVLATPAVAEDLVSASFRLRGAGVAAGALPFAQGPGASGSGLSLGQIAPAGPSGASGGLTTLAPGFWPIVRGELPTLDVDGDDIPAFLDDDDDADGLDDTVETDTGVFVSPDDTGTDPSVFDSDGDGFGDGAEVAAGSNPNDPQSVPMAQIPVLPPFGAPVLLGVLALAGIRALRKGAQRRRPS